MSDRRINLFGNNLAESKILDSGFIHGHTQTGSGGNSNSAIRIENKAFLGNITSILTIGGRYIPRQAETL